MIVLLHLGDQLTLAQVVQLRDPDTADLRTYAVYDDGHMDVLDVAGATRGDGEGQWRELPPMPELAAPAPAAEPEPDRRPASAIAAPPPRMPAIVIIRS